jgi:hypothetical protein
VAWRRWARQETLKRLILCNFILDGQFAFSTGCPASLRHLNHLVIASCDDRLFNAPDAVSWASAMRQIGTFQAKVPLRHIYDRLLSQQDAESALASMPASLFGLTHYVVIEALAAHAVEIREAGCDPVAGPGRQVIARALLRWYSECRSHCTNHRDELQLVVRWHSIFIALLVNVNALVALIRSSKSRESWWTKYGMTSFCSGFGARRALLHATAIRNLVERAPSDISWPTHLATCTFDAAIITHAYVTASSLFSQDMSGQVELSDEVDWQAVGYVGLVPDQIPTQSRANWAVNFICEGARTVTVNGFELSPPFHLGSFTGALRSAGMVWGRAQVLADVLDECNE